MKLQHMYQIYITLVFYLCIVIYSFYSYPNILLKNRYGMKAVTSYHISFAFQSFKKYDRPSYLSSKIKHYEIVIDGLNNKILRHQIINLLNNHKPAKSILSYKDLKVWINKLQQLGIFQSIHVKHHNNDLCQIIYLNLTINPLIKTVKIRNCRQKLIPLSYLYHTFQNQLGKPLNFVHIRQKIALIKKWYTDHGYMDVHINVQYFNNIIEIEIDEPIVKTTHIIVNSPHISEEEVEGYEFVHKDYLKETLQTYIRGPLNLLKLGKVLTDLKNKNLFKQSDYKIHRYDHEIVLCIYIEPLNYRSTYLFSKKYFVTQNLLELIESFSNQGLFFRHLNHNFSFLNIPKIYKIYNALIMNSTINSRLLYKMSQYDFMVYPSFLKIYSELNNSMHNDWNLPGTFFISNNNLGFRHAIYYLSKYCFNCLIDISIPDIGRSIDIKYEIPLIKTCHKVITNIIIRFNKIVYLDHMDYHSASIKDSISVYAKHSLVNHKNILIHINHCFLSSLNLSAYINIQQSISQILFFKNYIRFNQLRDYILSSYDSCYFSRKYVDNLTKLTKYKLGLKLPLSAIDTNNQLINFSLYDLEISYSIPNNIPHNISNIYINKITHKLTKKCHIRKNTLMIYLQSVQLIDKVQDIPFHEDSVIIDHYSKKYINLPTNIQNCKLEYYLYNYNDNITYCFVDYFHNNKHFVFNKIHYNDYSYTYDYVPLRISYGVGLKIITPIKQIPSLRFEYGYNINNKQCLHLKVEPNN
uniref:POTRA domain-containing protein n=1 Tax=Hommersandiophycus borowitzkae TaxID=268573 RepID=A0A1G4NU07_9FLOR|nr:Hypothetical protein ORF_4 [Hommersandiophycus borowitzkae]SCW22148.1 Hypothetical protein ORF_4 [Hommersandiophycus borowitzkae]